MDRIAVTKVGEFNSQNIANVVVGAFASMQHSAPDLFSELAKKASEIIHTFQEQELEQLLWAFASLYEPADPIFDSLDRFFEDHSQLRGFISENTSNNDEQFVADRNGGLNGSFGSPVLTFSRDQFGTIAWSYDVFGEMDRSFFSYVWKNLSSLRSKGFQNYIAREDMMFASQLHLVNQCLKLEFPHLQLSLCGELEDKVDRAGKTKRFNQKKVGRLLVSTGLEWVKEYVVDGYTLDAVIVDKKLALEIHGPTHFSINTGVNLLFTHSKFCKLLFSRYQVES